MATTLTALLVHIIFSTKNRERLISPAVESAILPFIGGICRNNRSPLLASNAVEDHVHLFVSLSKNIALADLMLQIKRDSSNWIKTEVNAPRFAWQEGYAAFSVGQSGSDDVINYVANQKEHHKHVSFQDELRLFFTKYGIEYDENLVWG
jgi:putative transposase